MRNRNYFSVIVILFVCFGLTGCDPYSGFGCIAPEAHPAVGRARSLSQQQLETAFVEIQKLSAENASKNYETQFTYEEIPNNLAFLNAEVIRVYRTGGPYVILANCFDERIELSLSSLDDKQESITLYWAEPTNENSYLTGSQVLWQREK